MDTRPISSLKEWDKNPRSISETNFKRLKKQIQKLGQYKPLLITEDGTVIGGNMRLKAYKELGITDIWVSIVKADTEEKKIEYALSDNDRAGQYEGDQLSDLIGNFPTVEWGDYAVDIKPPLLVNDLIDQYKEVIEDDVPEPPNKEVIEDDVPEPPKEAISKLGEVYTLGRHRLMCGDATKIEDVEKLMDGQKADMVFTDPPYGIGLNTDWDNREVIGDEEYFDISFIFNLGIENICLFGADYFMPVLATQTGTMLVWDKRVEEAKDKMKTSAFEMLWVNKKVQKVIFRKMWGSFLGGRERIEAVHPTQKPLSLLQDVMSHTKAGNVIVDLFGGSGSTLIACEQTNRTCYMMELDPLYCDVIRKRFKNFVENNKKQ